MELPPLPLLESFAEPIAIAVRILGLALLAGVTSIVFAMLYRWYSREQAPVQLAILIGLSAIALWLGTIRTLSQFIDPIDEPLTLTLALVNSGAFVAGALASMAGNRVGDRLANSSRVFIGGRSLEGEVSPFVEAVGRFISVKLPDTIEDIDGYDPVDDAVKTSLAGRTLLFPRGLTVTELRSRLVDRLREDYDVGHVDIDLSADGTVDYLAVGSRVAGLGPTLAPGSVAIAVTADPPYESTPGDTIQLWSTGESPTRLATGELRGTAGDTVTIALDEADALQFEHGQTYRLMTLSSDARPDREFATMLRTADETMGVVEVEVGAPLDGLTVAALDVTAIAIRDKAGSIDGVPARDRVITGGDSIYAIARPDILRRLEENALLSTV